MSLFERNEIARLPVVNKKALCGGAMSAAFSSASVLALAAMMASAPQTAQAAAECGVASMGAILNCAGGNYPTAITYTGSNGLTINLNNPAITATSSANGAVDLEGTSGDLTVNATNFDTLNGSAVSKSGIYVKETGGAGNVAVTIAGGTIHASATGALAQTTGSGNASVTMTGGTVTAASTFVAFGLDAAATTGSAHATLSGGTITTTGTSAYGVNSVSSTGNATTTITGGTVGTSGNLSYGAYASLNSGSGIATVEMSGGSITTTGTGANSLYSKGSVNGQAVIRMTGGTVSASGNNASGIMANIVGAIGTYDVSVTGGTVTGGAGTGAAIQATATSGGTITIGSDAIVNAGASGIALSQTGAATITIGGTVTGNINLSNAANSLTITGGSIAGNINSGGNTALNFDLGAGGSFAFAAPYTVTGMDSIAMTSGTATIGNTISTNTFAVHGGTMNLTGAVTAANPVTVDGGLLSVNGTLTAPSLTVQTKGTLGGNGTVGATTIQSGGTIAPGNSIGTLHINGAFAANAGSIYQVEADPTSNASDLILVNGAATIASGATMNVTKNPAGTFQTGAQYTVLTASGGVTGTYALTGDTAVSPYLALREQQDANNIYLRVIQTADPASAATTANQQQTATGTDSVPTSGVGTAVLNTPDATTTRTAFDALSGEALASAKGILISSSVLVRDTTFDRLRDVVCTNGAQGQTRRAGCVAAGDKPSLWMQGFGDWGHTFGNANSAGVSQTTGGFLAGVDVPVSDWRLGIFGGYSRSDFNVATRASAGASDTYHLGAYGGTLLGDFNLRLGASYSWSGIDTERLVAFNTFTNDLRASYNAGTAQVFGEIGRSFQAGRFALEPFANLAYVGVHTKGFSETGGDAALTSRPDTTQDMFATFGVRPSTEISIGSISATLRGMAGWRHTFGDITPSSLVSFAGSTAFTVTGAPIAKEAGVVEAGVSANLCDSAAIGLTYGGQFSNRETDHGIRGTLAVSF